MKSILCLALLAMGVALPGCVRSVGVYEERYPRHLGAYDGSYGHHYRPHARPYSPYSRSFGEPRYYERRDHRHHYRDRDDGVNLRFQVRD
jgi:hypothetical protein